MAKSFGKINLKEKLDEINAKTNESKETKHKGNKSRSGGGSKPGSFKSKKPPSFNTNLKLTDTLDVIKKRVMAHADEEMILAWKYQAVHVAAHFNQIEDLKLLLAFGMTVEAVDANECTALHRAVEAGSLEACELLLQHKANIEARDIDQMTPLMYAAR